MSLLDEVTRALRAGSPTVLAGALGRLLRSQPLPLRDQRDLLVALAPIHDCATRLGLDPAVFFEAAVHDHPTELAELVRVFARRDDVTPDAFGFVVEDAPDGPRYSWRVRSDRAASAPPLG